MANGIADYLDVSQQDLLGSAAPGIPMANTMMPGYDQEMNIIEDRCLIGMGAIVLDNAVVGEGSIVGAGAVVTAGRVIPPGSLVLGVPGKVIRPVTDADKEQIEEGWQSYLAKLKEIRAELG